MIARTPDPPYFAVIFTSLRTESNHGYKTMSDKMLKLATSQKGFLGFESARDQTGITISYWKSLKDIQNWKAHTEHLEAQVKGKEIWYTEYTVRICKVERTYSFSRKDE